MSHKDDNSNHVHEEQSHKHTDYVDNDRESKYCTYGEKMSHEEEDHNDETKDEDT